MSKIVSIKNALSAGELSPSLYGRTDLQKWTSGASTCRNFFVDYKGGVKSRAGLAYVGTCKQKGRLNPPVDLPFQFSLNQGYVLEFGNEYLRFKSNGAYITEDPIHITNISNATQAVITVPNHGYAIGDWVFITGVKGMTEFNGLTWIINNILDINTFTVTDLFGNLVDSTTFPAYINHGTSARIYELETPYQTDDLPYLKYTQSADTMTLTCVNANANVEYPSYSLERFGVADWSLTQEVFGAVISPPQNLVVTAQSSDIPTTWYSYTVTAVDSDTGEESIASDIVNIQNNDIALSAGSNTLVWDQVDGADSYNIYAATPSYSVTTPISSIFGFVGASLGPNFVDTNIQPDFSTVPPSHSNPFDRGSITEVKVTAGGINYSQETVSWSVSTSTGTGFDGFPIVGNGSVIGFIITDPGKGYKPSDTITFSDSGGGIAKGLYTVSSNANAGDKIFLNNIRQEWVDFNDSLTAGEIRIGSTQALSLQSLVDQLNASSDINLTCATYTFDPTHLYVSYKTPGTVGNAFFLSDVAPAGWVRSAPTLTGGGVVGSGATAKLVVGKSSGTYPGVCAYFQQRRVYASSLNKPDTYWMSQPGLFLNMDSSIPVTDGDSITGTPWAQQINGIQFLVPMPGGLVVLTGKGAWQLNGGQQAAITPSNQDAVPQAYNGCNSTVQPIVNNYDIIYVQSKGSILRDLSYNFFTNIYTGTDLTILSNHLFTGFQSLRMAYAEEPYKLIWVVRNDGTLLCLTYMKEQEVFAWTRHDTNGRFVSVCSVTEPPVDAVYVITKRFIQSTPYYYSERMDNRIWANVEQSFCVDAGLMTPITYPDTYCQPLNSGLGSHTFVTTDPLFTDDNIGDIIRVDGGSGVITSILTTQRAIVNVQQPLTILTPNNPGGRPLQAAPGEWSLTKQVTQVSGLNHLEGEEVTILADGSVVPNQTVTNGTIVLPAPASIIVVGLPYTCQVQTLYVDHEGQDGTAQNKRKLISSVGLRVESSRGIQVGSDQVDASTQPNFAPVDWTDMNEIKERTNLATAGFAVPLYTGDWYKNISSNWTVKGQVAVQQVYPLPANLLSVILYWTLGDDA